MAVRARTLRLLAFDLWYNTTMSNSIVYVYGRIYLLTCLVNGKRYVGQTVNSMSKRLYGHFNSPKHSKAVRNSTPLANAIKKYGKENFGSILLCSCSSQEELNLMEDLYIAALNTMVDGGNGYNLERGGAKGKASEKTKALQSQQRKGIGNSRYIHEINNQEIVDLYKQGYGAPKISKILGVRQGTVEKRLKASQVVMRSVGHQYWSDEERKVVGARMKIRHAGPKNPAYRHDISTEQLIALYSEGFSLAEIGRKLSTSHGIVGKRLKKAGITLRPYQKKNVESTTEIRSTSIQARQIWNSMAKSNGYGNLDAKIAA